MITLKEIQQCNNMHNIPKTIHVNKNVIMDYRLVQTFETGGERKTHDKIYDFDVFLKKYNVNLQRPYVWQHHQQNEYILSILLEKPLENVIIVQHDLDKFGDRCINYVIDGKQRLLTIKKFVNNEFPVIINGKEVYWKDFDDDSKFYFRSRANDITATIYYSDDEYLVTDDMKIILFNYYNFAGTPIDDEHKNRLQSLLNND